jgi:hypothetical protein
MTGTAVEKGRSLEAVRLEMMKVFQRAAKQRSERPKLVDDPCEPYPDTAPCWAIYERRELLEAVNVELLSRGLPLVDEPAIKKVEYMAVGHCDYADKFTLYCAELATGMSDIRP